MRWFPRPRPQHGDIRKGPRFAWWPTLLEDGSKVWLERYWRVEVFEGNFDLGGAYSYWRGIRRHPLEHQRPNDKAERPNLKVVR